MPENRRRPAVSDRAQSATAKLLFKSTERITRQALQCGCFEFCRCDHKLNPTPKRIDAYREAVEHLAAHKLGAAAITPELQELWRRGGSDRTVAEMVNRRWTA